MAAEGIQIPMGTPTYVALTDLLRRDILTGQIPHSSRLTTEELMARYGASQMPVREALHALQGEGLLTILPRKGARVLTLDARFVRNVYDLRRTIEAYLAGSSLSNIREQDIPPLEAIQRRFAAAVHVATAEQFFNLNREFHLALYRHADNPEALRVYDHYHALLGSLRHVYGYSPERRTRMVADHEDTLAALRTRDKERLTHSIQTQSDQGMEDLLANMSR